MAVPIVRFAVIRAVCVAGLLVASMMSLVDAHPISISRASVYVNRKHAIVRIKVFVEDLYLFHELQPNSADVLESSTIERGIELHEQFLRQRFEMTDHTQAEWYPRVCLTTACRSPS